MFVQGSMKRGRPRRGRHQRGSVAHIDTPPDSGSMLPCHRRSRVSSSALLRESGSLTSSPLDSQHSSSWLQESQSSMSSTECPKGWKLVRIIIVLIYMHFFSLSESLKEVKCFITSTCCVVVFFFCWIYLPF